MRSLIRMREWQTETLLVQKKEKLRSLGEEWRKLVPRYKSRSFRDFKLRFKWDKDDADFIRAVSETRCEKRIDTYIIPGELARSRGSIRFGRSKSGHGFHAKRGDFCLVGGVFDAGHLTVLYRRVELIGGLHFDLALFREVEKQCGPIKDVTIHAPHAFVFALKGNSNEKLYKKLIKYYETQERAC